jgi:exodeoxyribonuclease-5
LKRAVRKRKPAILIGNAGSGKTTIVTQHLIPELREDYLICVTAFTHRACGVIREKLAQVSRTSPEVRTLSSLLGFREVHDNQSKNPNFEQVQPSEVSGYGLIIVDEASMVPQQYLNSLLSSAYESGVAVIFVGDDAQLPPVGNGGSAEAPALNIQGATVARLTKVHRNGGPILAAAHRIRTAPDGVIPEWKPAQSDAGNLVVHQHRDEMKAAVVAAIQSEQRACEEDTFRIVCHTNKAVNSWNTLCRNEALGEGAAPFVFGELLMARNAIFTRANAWNYEGKPETGASAELTIVSDPVLEKEAFNNLTAFRSLLNEVGGPSCKVEVWKLTARLDQARIISFWASDSEAHKELQKLLKVMASRAKEASREYSRVSGHTSREWWRSFFVIKKLFGHMVGPRYAMTIHKSQGGQWDSVFADMPDMQYLRRSRPSEFKKLLYTGVTRASRNLHILTAGK